LYICGNSKCPENCAAGSIYDIFAVELILEIETDIIRDASCVLVTELGRDFIKSLLVNRVFTRDFNAIIADISNYYLGVPQKAVISALKDALNKYKLHKKNTTPNKSNDLLAQVGGSVSA
jgi:hypothetical protein